MGVSRRGSYRSSKSKVQSPKLDVKILVVLNRMAHVRHFDRAIRLLADRGHRVVLASQEDDLRVGRTLEAPSIEVVRAPQRRGDDWTHAAKAVRRTRDFVRYLHPRYADALLLRRRGVTSMSGGAAGQRQ